MLVCHCNLISDKDIEAIVLDLLKDDPWQLIVPAKVFREFEKKGRCCGCVPNMVDIIIKVTENYHLQQARNSAELIDVQERLKAMREKRKGVFSERPRTGHRAA
jgi:bacterioferritin-associated ferredoxin